MNPEANADTAVLVSAILMLVAIASKLITANLVTRSKRIYTKLDARRRDIISKLKEVQLKRTSARGTLEFWERRRTETSQRVSDATRDLENYATQLEGTEFAAAVDVPATGADSALLEEPVEAEDARPLDEQQGQAGAGIADLADAEADKSAAAGRNAAGRESDGRRE